MSDTDANANDTVGGTNPFAVDHATSDQMKRLLEATQAIQAAYKERRGTGQLNRKINDLNQLWVDMTGLPGSDFAGLWQPINRRNGTSKRKPMDDHSNILLESAPKRGTAAAGGEKEDEPEEEDDDDSRMEEDEESHDAGQTVRAARAFLLIFVDTSTRKNLLRAAH